MPTPKPQEPHDDYISRCMSDDETLNKFPDEEQRYAVCESMWDEAKQTAFHKYRQAFAETSYTDYPQAAINNAKTALKWADENGWASCGTPVGKSRANQLANGKAITRDTIARMAAFERHRQNSKRKLGDGCGRLMWLAWGGDEGIEWAQRKLKQIDNGKFAAQRISFDYDETLTKAMDLVKEWISKGAEVYIISARSNKQPMLNRAKELGIPESRVYATGSNKAKIEQVKKLNISKHYDNNADVIKELGTIGELYGKA